MEENKCENCGGEGLIHQGESIKFTCSVCAGTGKSVDGEVTASAPVEEAKEESFLEESSDVSSDSSEEVA